MWAFGVILYMILSGWQPFFHASKMKLYKLILAGKFEFPEHRFGETSDDVKDLITNLLNTDQNKRYTADQALSHSWFRFSPELLHVKSLKHNQEALRRFLPSRRKFAGAVKAVIATHRINSMQLDLIALKKDIELNGLNASSSMKINSEAFVTVDDNNSDASLDSTEEEPTKPRSNSEHEMNQL